MPKDNLNSYIHICNVSFIYKVCERVVAIRFQIGLNCLFNVSQSVYKHFNSAHTALLKVHNYILLNMDKGNVTALALLDLCYL